MRRFWAICLIMLTGCGDPESSRLSVGSRAMVVDHYKDTERASDGAVVDIRNMIYPRAEFGTMVKVVDDAADPEHDWSSRKVMVRVLDGPLKERTGKIVRWSLRPE